MGLNRALKASGGAPTPKTIGSFLLAPPLVARRSSIVWRRDLRLFPLSFPQGALRVSPRRRYPQNTQTHRLFRPMATGLNVVRVTGSSAGCCFRRRRFCGRFLCCCDGGGDWLPSPPPEEDARGVGGLAPGVTSSFFSPLPLLSSGVAAATTRRERREEEELDEEEGRAIRRAPCDDADAAPAPAGRAAAEEAAERGTRACCIVER